MNRAIIIWIFSVFMLLSVSLDAEDYIWPLHGERRLSSSFSEFRDGHFHSGIDIRTYGRSGYPCLAVGDGDVRRVKIRPGGYGKALYLTLNDGRTAVYAHLRCFNRSIDSLLYYHRLTRGSSWCDVYLEPGRFVFSRGDTVAYSGRSGTIAPHLHFEIRDAAGRPINPLIDLYSVPDRSNPVFSGIKIFPVGVESRVNTSPLPAVFDFQPGRGNSYLLGDTLHLQGKFGVGVSVWDSQGYGRFFMAPDSLELVIDGKSIYRRTNRRFSFSQASQIILEYSVDDDNADGRYTLLFSREGQTRSDRFGTEYISSQNNIPGSISLEKGLHRAVITAVDHRGNSSRGEFFFWLHQYPEILEAKELSNSAQVIVRAVDPDGGELREKLQYSRSMKGSEWKDIELRTVGNYSRGWYERGESELFRYTVTDDEGMVIRRYFSSPRTPGGGNSYCECSGSICCGNLILDVRTDRILASLPRIRRIDREGNQQGRLVQTGPMRYLAIYTKAQISNGLNVFEVSGVGYRGNPLHNVTALRILKFSSGSSAAVELSDGFRFTLRSPGVGGQSLCRVEELITTENAPEGYQRVAPPFHLDFAREDFPRRISLDCETGPGVVLLRWDGEDEWDCVGVPFMEGGSVKLDRPGIYSFYRDGIPPRLDQVRAEKRMGGTGFFKPYIYYIPAQDEISGVDPYSPKVIINSNEVVCEWDAIKERLYIPVPVSFPEVMAKMTVEVSDRAGNRCAREYSFKIR